MGQQGQRLAGSLCSRQRRTAMRCAGRGLAELSKPVEQRLPDPIGQFHQPADPTVRAKARIAIADRGSCNTSRNKRQFARH